MYLLNAVTEGNILLTLISLGPIIGGMAHSSTVVALLNVFEIASKAQIK